MIRPGTYWGRSTRPMSTRRLMGRAARFVSQVSPWYSYIVVHLPKITLFSLPLAIYALVSGAGSGFRGMTMTGIVGLVGGMSLLGHKVRSFPL